MNKQPKILFISGFLFNAKLFQNISNFQIDIIDVIDYSEEELITKLKNFCHYDLIIGFSLGSAVLLKYNQIFQTKNFILISPFFNFIQNKDNPHGTSIEVLSSFISLLKEDPNALLKKFNFLNSLPDVKLFKFLVENNKFKNLDNNKLLNWLNFLKTFNALTYSNIDKNLHIIYGMEDKIVNYRQKKYFKNFFNNISIDVIDNAPHAVFLKNPDDLNKKISHILA